MKRTILASISLIISIASAFAQYGIAGGELDYSFGVNGRVISYVNDLQQMNKIAETSDGKILVAGFKYLKGYKLILRRHHASGLLDTSFGNNGEAYTGLSTFPVYVCGRDLKDMILQPDGAILVAGTNCNPQTGNLPYSLWRFRPDGQLDSTFGVKGKIDFSRQVDAVRMMNVRGFNLSESKILVLYWNKLERYNLDGSLDNSFGTQGALTFDTAEHLLETAAGSLANGGDYIYVGGAIYSLYNPKVSRYRANGATDLSFGDGGTTFLSSCGTFYGDLRQIKVQRDRKVLTMDRLVPNTPATIIRRLTADGSCDDEFQYPPAQFWGTGMALQRDGKIVVSINNWLTSSIEDFRMFSNGVVDQTYQPAQLFDSYSDRDSFIITGDDKLVTLNFYDNDYLDSYKLVRLLP